MGTYSSFSLIVESTQIDILLRELASCACENDARQLISALPWKPAIQQQELGESGAIVQYRQGIGGLKLGKGESPSSYCLSFLFPPDGILARYEYGRRISLTVGDRIAIGSVWTSLYVGAEYSLLEATAATTDMSVLFQSSPSVKAVWRELAGRSSALALFFDAEDRYEWLLLHPELRTVVKPYKDSFCSPDFTALRPDEYGWEMLHLSHLASDL